MTVIGLDVGRGSAVLCCLEKFPDNVQQLYREFKRSQKFYKVSCSQTGIDKLLSLAPSVIVLEPSGHWYAHFWMMVAQHHDIKLCWVGNSDLDKQRGSYGFVNKRDEEDALCLAACYFDPTFINRDGSQRFLKYYYSDNQLICRLRQRFHEREQLQKNRTSFINQLRQRLAYEYPETVKNRIVITDKLGFSPFAGWLAQVHRSVRHDNKYKLSVAHQLNITLTDYTRDHARTIVNLEQRITDCNYWFETILALPCFVSYTETFNRFGFGLSLQVLLLYHCYPFAKFLVNGKPWIEREMGNNGKMQKRDRSLRKFQSYLGMGYGIKSSGDYRSKKLAGSELVRSHLYMWAVAMVTHKQLRIKNDLGQNLHKTYHQLRQTVKGKDAIIRLLFKTTRFLYHDLVAKSFD